MKIQFPVCQWLSLAIAVGVAGCAEESAVVAPPAEMVYVDLESGTPVTAPPSGDLPAAHPETGRRSLMPGLFCESCRKWRPAPPLEELQRNPESRKCPECQGTMSAEGPRP